MTVLDREAHSQVVDPLLEAFARDDVDRAGDRARAGLGRRRAQDFDALNLLGGQRVDRESRRHALAVEQDLRVAAAEPAQADVSAASRRALHRHAGQAFEQLTDGAVAVALDLVAADDDLRGSGLAALFGVVGAAAGDLDAIELRGSRCGCRRARW